MNVVLPLGGGHDEVAKEGQVIKAYVRHRGGHNEGNYSDGFEVVEDTKASPARGT